MNDERPKKFGSQPNVKFRNQTLDMKAFPRCTFCDKDFKPDSEPIRVNINHGPSPIMMCEPCVTERHNGDKPAARLWMEATFCGCNSTKEIIYDDTEPPVHVL